MIAFLRRHPLLWILPLVLVPAYVLTVRSLAHSEAETPDSPFIYDL